MLIIAYMLMYPVIFMALTGDWLWLEGWLFSGYIFVMGLSITIYLYIKDPALLRERMKRPGADNAESWDKYWFMFFIPLFLGWFVIMPFDAKRFEWTGEFYLWVKCIGGLCLIPSYYFIFMSHAQNTFLSPNIRIQKEREQKLVNTGVYRIVRHPMYLGFVFLMIGGPLLLSSMWGLLLGFLVVLSLSFRIVGEEKMLAKELEGYIEYKKKVKWRLFPMVW